MWDVAAGEAGEPGEVSVRASLHHSTASGTRLDGGDDDAMKRRRAKLGIDLCRVIL
ncbi:hypothetical protein [Breoghania sp. JC706]|uniref:hypothetical protein n=1 Tax=Breoghania sp. JC706 TaxID=3117732 RepID=UPI00300ABCB4